MGKSKSLSKKGHKLWKLGQHQQALECFNSAIDLDIKNRDAWKYRIRCYNAMRQYDKALESFIKAIEVFPNDSLIRYRLGVWYRERKQPQKSIELYEKVIEMNKGEKEKSSIEGMAWYAMGNAYFDMKEYDKSIESFKKSAPLKPDISVSDAYLRIGDAYLAMNNIDGAKENYQKALELATFNKGVVLQHLSQLKKERF